YYHPTHGVFLSLDPDPGDDDDVLTQNGYTYANNNPVMLVDPDGEWAWVAVNAGFAAYRGYKAYKAGKSKKQIAWAVASGFGPGRYFKGAKRVYRFAKKVNSWSNKKTWKHIKERHGSKSKISGKGKFRSNRTMKRTTRATARTKAARKGRYNRTIHEKTFKKYVGRNGNGKKTKRVRVIRDRNGRIVTSFPY
ncbi:RHS repeat-associated core domain-containing protein, partial [Virgibacillus pantothenticus]